MRRYSITSNDLQAAVAYGVLTKYRHCSAWSYTETGLMVGTGLARDTAGAAEGVLLIAC